MNLLRKNVASMSAYVPGEQPAADAVVIKLNTNENPYPPSPKVRQALLDAIGDGSSLRRYSDPVATAFRQAAAQAANMPLECVLAGNGSDELLALLVRAFVEPGESIAFPYPTYSVYETLARAAGAPTDTPDFPVDFTLPPALFETSAKLVFVCNPNAPSGTLQSNAALEQLARARPNAVVVVDEAYVEFAETNALGLVRRLPNVVVLRTLSKSHSLAGMRLGLLYGSAELIAGVSKVKDSYNLDRLAIAAGAAALSDPEWTRRNVDRVLATRERLTVALVALGLRVVPSQTNFVLARFASAEQAKSAYVFLKERGVLVRYFDQRMLDDALRITVGTDAEVDGLLGRLSEFLAVR